MLFKATPHSLERAFMEGIGKHVCQIKNEPVGDPFQTQEDLSSARGVSR
jgi:hypothetical protein